MSVPAEIKESYRNGERNIVVSADTFKAYDDAIVEANGYLVRVLERPIKDSCGVKYINFKDARVILKDSIA